MGSCVCTSLPRYPVCVPNNMLVCALPHICPCMVPYAHVLMWCVPVIFWCRPAHLYTDVCIPPSIYPSMCIPYIYLRVLCPFPCGYPSHMSWWVSHAYPSVYVPSIHVYIGQTDINPQTSGVHTPLHMYSSVCVYVPYTYVCLPHRVKTSQAEWWRTWRALPRPTSGA